MDNQQNFNISDDMQGRINDTGDAGISSSMDVSQDGVVSQKNVSADTGTEQTQTFSGGDVGTNLNNGPADKVVGGGPFSQPSSPSTGNTLDQSQPIHPSDHTQTQGGMPRNEDAPNMTYQVAPNANQPVAGGSTSNQRQQMPSTPAMGADPSAPVTPVSPNVTPSVGQTTAHQPMESMVSGTTPPGQQPQTYQGGTGQQPTKQQLSNEEKDQNVYNFLVQIIQEKHGNNLPWEQVTGEADRLYDELGDLLVSTFEPEMNEQQKEEFDKLYAQGYSNDELQMYLLQSIPNLEDRIQQILIDFRQRYLSS